MAKSKKIYTAVSDKNSSTQEIKLDAFKKCIEVIEKKPEIYIFFRKFKRGYELVNLKTQSSLVLNYFKIKNIKSELVTQVKEEINNLPNDSKFKLIFTIQKIDKQGIEELTKEISNLNIIKTNKSFVNSDNSDVDNKLLDKFNKPLVIIHLNDDLGSSDKNVEPSLLEQSVNFYNSNLMLRCFHYLQTEEIEKYLDWLEKDIESKNFSITKSKTANETLEYSFRAYSNSYLFGRHKDISPFSFHSELKFKEKFKTEKENFERLINQIKLKKIELNLLLVDDKWSKGLEQWGEGEYKSCDKVGKKDILMNLLHRKFNGIENITGEYKPDDFNKIYNDKIEKNNSFIQFNIECIPSADFNKIENAEFPKGCSGVTPPDIILLDYSFGENNAKGSDFFKKLIGKKNLSEEEKEQIEKTQTEKAQTEKTQTEKPQEKIKKGPFGQYWIMPITAFSNAFIDDLRNKGYGFIDSQYNLSRGADFINTPYLFLYYFTKIINEQLSFLSKITELQESIKNLITSLEQKPWEEIEKGEIKIKDENKNFQEIFRNHINNKKEIDYFLSNETKKGLLKSIYDSFDEKEISNLGKQLNFYEQLLYNLAYRNYKGNEEIIIFHDLLKNLK